MLYARMKQSLFYSCQRIPILYRYGITLSICMVVVFFWYYIFSPYTKYVLAMQDYEYEQLQENYIKIQHATLDLDSLHNYVQSSLYETQQVKQMSYADVVFSVMDAAHKHSLTFVRYAYDTNIDRQWYTKKQISFQVHGSIKNINAFLYYINNVPELLSCNSLVIMKYDKNYELMCVMRYAKIKPLQLSLKS